MNTHAHPTSMMNTSERLSQLNFEIYEVGHQECLAIEGNIVSQKKLVINITHMLNLEFKPLLKF
jgi:hypothetical protein